MPEQVEFVLTAEAGILERQAVLLCESIRFFGGTLAVSAVTVVSPRKSRRPCAATLRKLENLQVDYLPLELENNCPEYGPAFKVQALAHVERRSGPPILVQVDTDTLFLGEPSALLQIGAAAARPVDVKGMCTLGQGDAFDAYWRRLCDLLGVDYEGLPIIRTTVDRLRVRASYNGGLIAARRAAGLFQLTEAFLLRLVDAGMKPWAAGEMTVKAGSEVVSKAGSAYWGTSQAAFSLAAVHGGHAVDILPDTYNFPLHLFADDAPAVPVPLVHIHYHWLASSAAGAARLLDPRLGMRLPVHDWLRSRLPLDTPGRLSGSSRAPGADLSTAAGAG